MAPGGSGGEEVRGVAGDPTCPACAADDWQPWQRVRGVDGRPHVYGRCGRCGLGRLLTAPAPEVLAAWYDEGYFRDGGDRGGYADYAGEAAVHRFNARARLDRVEAALAGSGQPDPRSGRGSRIFLELGCATGETLDEARARGWTAYGVEPSRWAADRAREQGHTVASCIEVLPPEVRGVSAVGLFQVLEHVPDPASTLRAVAARMAPGAALLCETWDAGSRLARLFGRHWQQLSAPSVLWVLDAPSGARLMHRAGLEPASWRRTGKAIGVGTVVGQLAGRLPSRLAAAPGPQRLVAPVTARLAALGLPYRGDDLVTFVARRPRSPAVQVALGPVQPRQR